MRAGKYDPCPCGSGKQYKWCCWETDERAARLNREPSGLADEDFIVELDPKVEDQVDALLARLERGDRRGIKEQLEALIKKHPRLHLPYFGMGVYHAVTEKDPAAGLPFFERAVKIFPYFGEGHYNLANCALQIGDVKKATISFRAAVRHCTDNPAAVQQARDQLRFLEKLAREQGIFANLDEMIVHQTVFEEAFEAMKRGDFQQAEAGFRKVLAKDPNHVQSHGNLGLVLASLGRKAEALASLDRALELDPKYKPARLNRQTIEEMTEGQPMRIPGIEVNYYLDQLNQG